MEIIKKIKITEKEKCRLTCALEVLSDIKNIVPDIEENYNDNLYATLDAECEDLINLIETILEAN